MHWPSHTQRQEKIRWAWIHHPLKGFSETIYNNKSRVVTPLHIIFLNPWYALIIWKRAFLLQRQVKLSTTAHRRQPLYVFTAPTVLHWSYTLMKRATYQVGYAWEQTTILTLPTSIPLLCLAEHAVCQQFLSCIGCMRASYTCLGHCLDLLAGFMTGI